MATTTMVHVRVDETIKAQAANALDHNGQKTVFHLQAAVQKSVETTLYDTLITLSQRAE